MDENKLKLSDESVVALLQLFLKCTFEQINMQDELLGLDFVERDGKLLVCNPPQTITIPKVLDDEE